MKTKKTIISTLLCIFLVLLMTLSVSAHTLGHCASMTNVRTVTYNTITGEESKPTWSWDGTSDHPTLYVSNISSNGHMHCGILPKYSVTEGNSTVSWPSPTLRVTTTPFTAWYQGNLQDQ